MNMKDIVRKLGISMWGIFWARITGGWRGVAVYFSKALTNLLRRLPTEELLKYASLIKQVIELVNTIVANFVPEAYKDAGTKTVEAIATLAQHLEDGEYTEAELDIDIDGIESCIDAWKSIVK